jgi:hypothetical protein
MAQFVPFVPQFAVSILKDIFGVLTVSGKCIRNPVEAGMAGKKLPFEAFGVH